MTCALHRITSELEYELIPLQDNEYSFGHCSGGASANEGGVCYTHLAADGEAEVALILEDPNNSQNFCMAFLAGQGEQSMNATTYYVEKLLSKNDDCWGSYAGEHLSLKPIGHHYVWQSTTYYRLTITA